MVLYHAGSWWIASMTEMPITKKRMQKKTYNSILTHLDGHIVFQTSVLILMNSLYVFQFAPFGSLVLLVDCQDDMGVCNVQVSLSDLTGKKESLATVI
jgi:hypothetical protein